VTSYSVYVESHIAEVLHSLRPKERNQVLRLLDKLRRDPFLEGDYAEQDSIGRPIQVVIIGRHALVYWVDHPVREVKVIDLRPAGN
jgi:mRNA-degrading endonuclease RelE of RelBE toxin-antitoxin system